MDLAALRTNSSGEDMAPEETSEEAATALDKAAVLTAAAAVAGTSANSIDAELAEVALRRDIGNETAAPPTRTTEETEQRASEAPATGGDPGTGHGIPEGAASAADAAAEEAGATNSVDLSGYGLDAATTGLLHTLPEEKLREMVAELNGKRSSAAKLRNKAKELAEQERDRKASRQPGGSLFGSILGMFPRTIGSPKQRNDKQLRAVQAALSPEIVRERVRSLRKQEIFEAAEVMSTAHDRMAASSRQFNKTLLATEAGRRFEAGMAERMRQTGVSREEILVELGKPSSAGNPLRADMSEAFKADAVKSAWSAVEQNAAAVELGKNKLTGKVDAFSQHFPGHIDVEKAASVAQDALDKVENTFKMPLARDPAAINSLKERFERMAKMVKELIERLLSMLGLAPKPA